jgi:hypothetical protein
MTDPLSAPEDGLDLDFLNDVNSKVLQARTRAIVSVNRGVIVKLHIPELEAKGLSTATQTLFCKPLPLAFLGNLIPVCMASGSLTQG